jgi:hypothetical protein
MGGLLDTKKQAQRLAGMGRNGDTILAHINPQEAKVLKALGGSGTTNKRTGLMQFDIGGDGHGGYGSNGPGTGSGGSGLGDGDSAGMGSSGSGGGFVGAGNADTSDSATDAANAAATDRASNNGIGDGDGTNNTGGDNAIANGNAFTRAVDRYGLGIAMNGGLTRGDDGEYSRGKTAAKVRAYSTVEDAQNAFRAGLGSYGFESMGDAAGLIAGINADRAIGMGDLAGLNNLAREGRFAGGPDVGLGLHDIADNMASSFNARTAKGLTAALFGPAFASNQNVTSVHTQRGDEARSVDAGYSKVDPQTGELTKTFRGYVNDIRGPIKALGSVALAAATGGLGLGLLGGTVVNQGAMALADRAIGPTNTQQGALAGIAGQVGNFTGNGVVSAIGQGLGYANRVQGYMSHDNAPGPSAPSSGITDGGNSGGVPSGLLATNGVIDPNSTAISNPGAYGTNVYGNPYLYRA